MATFSDLCAVVIFLGPVEQTGSNKQYKVKNGGKQRGTWAERSRVEREVGKKGG